LRNEYSYLKKSHLYSILYFYLFKSIINNYHYRVIQSLKIFWTVYDIYKFYVYHFIIVITYNRNMGISLHRIRPEVIALRKEQSYILSILLKYSLYVDIKQTKKKTISSVYYIQYNISSPSIIYI